MIASAAAALALRLPNLPQPLGPDQGIMATIGEGILRGQVPYRDAWEMATPAIFFTYAGIYKLAAPFFHAPLERMVAVPLADMIVVAFSCAMVALAAGRASPTRGRLAAWVGGLCFALFASGRSFGMNSAGDLTAGTHWYLAQRETFINLLAACGAVIALGREGPSRGRGGGAVWRFLALGLLAGGGIAYKFPAGALFIGAAALCFAEAWASRQERSFPVRAGVGAAVIAAGATVVPLLLLAWFWRRGALAPMAEATLGYVHQIYGHAQHGLLATAKNGTVRTAVVVRENFWLWALAAGAVAWCGAAAADRLRRPGALRVASLGVWWLSAMLYVAAHREFFGYHYLVLLPPMSALAGVAVAVASPHRDGTSPKRDPDGVLREPARLIMAAALAANLVVFAGLNYKHYTSLLRVVSGGKGMSWYYSHFTAYPNHEYSFPADLEVARHLAATTGPHEPVYVLGGIEPVIYLLSERRCPSRFVYSWFLTDTARADVPLAAQFRQELARSLRDDPPVALVTIGPLERFAKYPVLHDALAPRYSLEREFPDGRFLYRLRATGSRRQEQPSS